MQVRLENSITYVYCIYSNILRTKWFFDMGRNPFLVPFGLFDRVLPMQGPSPDVFLLMRKVFRAIKIALEINKIPPHFEEYVVFKTHWSEFPRFVK
jgi:hypothetical protein